MKISYLGSPFFLNPETVYIHMEDPVPHILGSFLGPQQSLPPIGCNGFMGFDSSKPGVFIAQISKAGYQQPFVS